MTSARMLGVCGIVAAGFSSVGGFCRVSEFIGVAALVMLFGNIFSVLRG